MKWQILIASEVSRKEFLVQLLGQLEPQIDALGLRKFDQVDVMVHEDKTGELYGKTAGIGMIREYMRQRACGDYINFIDSDDLISPDYVSQILPLLDGTHQVGFEVEAWNDHQKMAPTYHSLKYGNWTNPVNGRMGLEGAYCRDISHICPMRRDLALKAPMSGGFGEDCRWANDLRALNVVKTEHYIDKVLYFYMWRGNKKDATDAHDPWRLQMIERIANAENCAA